MLDDLANTIRVMLIVTGVKSSQIFGGGKEAVLSAKKKNIESELGIEFVD